jgi:transposase InsO family protein
MTRGGIREDVAAVRERSARAGRLEKGHLLTACCATTGYHRKAAIRRLRAPGGGGGAAPRPGARPRRYGPAVAAALARVWEASGRLCAKRLVPFLPELLPLLERHGELVLEAPVRARLLELSAATADRLLRPHRRPSGDPRTPAGRPPTAAALRVLVPLRTWGEWAGAAPGALQADMVLHCGEVNAGFYLTTLVAVDVASGWTELQAVWGLGGQRVGAALHLVRRDLPVPLRELHTDNGSEFLNEAVYPWCRRHGIRFTRGRPHRKNDQAWVEQKNGDVVRRLVGYDRYSTKAALAALQEVYRLARLWVNFCRPVRKLLAKERVGAKVRKRFDLARTPYQRLRAAGALEAARSQALEAQYRQLNPVALRAELEAALERLWALADRGPAARSAAAVAG